MIWIRADAGKEMGTGHVMRCLSVALEAVQAGEKVCFLAADEATRDFLETKGIVTDRGNPCSRVLGTDFRKMETELELLGELLAREPGPVLVDSYFATPRYLRELRRMTRVAYMDDERRFPCPADLIINYNIYGEGMEYGKEPEEREAKCLLGPRYAPLRAQFQNVCYRVRSRVRKILVTTGGADKYNLSGQLLEAMLDSGALRETEFYVVSGAMNQYYDGLVRLSEKDGRVHVYSNVPDMAEYMASCDLAVAAGGSTLYELCAVGVPFLCFSFAENQRRAVRTFAEKQIAAFGGDYLSQGKEMIAGLVKVLEELAEDAGKRQALSSAQRGLVDSRGAFRIAEELMTWTK